MKNKEILNLAALGLGVVFVVSGCGVLEQAADSGFEYKATLDSKGALVNCYSNTNPKAETGGGQATVIFQEAFCFDKSSNARKTIGMSLSEPFSGEVTVDNIGVTERPAVYTNPQSQP
jgi:hypothetical protein